MEATPNRESKGTNSPDNDDDIMDKVRGAVPQKILDLIIPPPVAEGEDERQYWNLFLLIQDEVDVYCMQDWLDLTEIVNERWERRRLDRIKTTHLDAHRVRALASLLSVINPSNPLGGHPLPSDFALVRDYMAGDAKAKKAIAKKFEQAGVSTEAILTEAFVSNIDIQAALERLAQAKTVRRQKSETLWTARKAARESAENSKIRARQQATLDGRRATAAE